MNAGVINFAVYENGNEFLGMARCTFPNSANKVFTVNGAGIPGDVDVPVIGHKDAMRVSFEFTDSARGVYALSEERTHLLDCRVAHEDYDHTKGQIAVQAHKYVMNVFPISRSGGDGAPAAPQSRTVECSCFSCKEYIDGKLVSNFDPLNFVDVDASGTNRLAAVKKALGK